MRYMSFHGSLDSLLAIGCIICENHHVGSCTDLTVIAFVDTLPEDDTLSEIHKSSTSWTSYFWSESWESGWVMSRIAFVRGGCPSSQPEPFTVSVRIMPRQGL